MPVLKCCHTADIFHPNKRSCGCTNHPKGRERLGITAQRGHELSLSPPRPPLNLLFSSRDSSEQTATANNPGANREATAHNPSLMISLCK